MVSLDIDFRDYAHRDNVLVRVWHAKRGWRPGRFATLAFGSFLIGAALGFLS